MKKILCCVLAICMALGNLTAYGLAPESAFRQESSNTGVRCHLLPKHLRILVKAWLLQHADALEMSPDDIDTLVNRIGFARYHRKAGVQLASDKILKEVTAVLQQEVKKEKKITMAKVRAALLLHENLHVLFANNPGVLREAYEHLMDGFLQSYFRILRREFERTYGKAKDDKAFIEELLITWYMEHYIFHNQFKLLPRHAQYLKDPREIKKAMEWVGEDKEHVIESAGVSLWPEANALAYASLLRTEFLRGMGVTDRKVLDAKDPVKKLVENWSEGHDKSAKAILQKLGGKITTRLLLIAHCRHVGAAEAPEVDKEYLERLMDQKMPAALMAELGNLQGEEYRLVLRALLYYDLSDYHCSQRILQEGKKAVRPLLALVKNKKENSQIRETAIDVMEIMKEAAAVPVLIRRVRDVREPIKIRVLAARALGRIKDMRGVPALMAATKDSETWLRQTAAQALGSLQDPRSRARLTVLLDDADERVRKAAQDALANLDETASKATLRLPGIRPLEGRDMSFDKDIRAAEEQGLVRKIEGEELESLLQPLDEEFLQSDTFWARLVAAAGYLKVVFAATKPDLSAEDLEKAFRDAMQLLRSGRFELCIVSQPPVQAVGKQDISWGFHAEKDEIFTDTGEDASNLPFLVRRIGNRLYMKNKFFRFFTTYAGPMPERESPFRPSPVMKIFFEVLLHDPMEDPSITGPLGIPPEKAHAFASMMAALPGVGLQSIMWKYAVAKDKIKTVEEALLTFGLQEMQGGKSLNQWTLQFYTPTQLAGLLRYHSGIQATQWRWTAMHELFRRDDGELLHLSILDLVTKEPAENADEKRSDEVLVRMVDVGKDIHPAQWEALKEKLGKTFYESLPAAWQEEHPLRPGRPVMSQLEILTRRGDLDAVPMPVASARLLAYLSKAFQWSLADIAQAIGKYLGPDDSKASRALLFYKAQLYLVLLSKYAGFKELPVHIKGRIKDAQTAGESLQRLIQTRGKTLFSDYPNIDDGGVEKLPPEQFRIVENFLDEIKAVRNTILQYVEERKGMDEVLEKDVPIDHAA